MSRRQFKTINGGGAAAGGVQIIRFELVDRIDCATCQARARVLSRPPGVTVVAEEDAYGRLLVYDLANGWLNRPDVDLVDPVSGAGARGYAARLDWDIDECAIDPYLTTKWEIISLVPLSTACP